MLHCDGILTYILDAYIFGLNDSVSLFQPQGDFPKICAGKSNSFNS